MSRPSTSMLQIRDVPLWCTAAMWMSGQTISGEHRADPRLCALDEVVVESKYDENVVVITEIKYSTTGGAMKGTYSGRVMR